MDKSMKYVFYRSTKYSKHYLEYISNQIERIYINWITDK
jgi:hypothetical protein